MSASQSKGRDFETKPQTSLSKLNTLEHCTSSLNCVNELYQSSARESSLQWIGVPSSPRFSVGMYCSSGRVGAVVRSLPPNPEIPGSTPGLVER